VVKGLTLQPVSCLTVRICDGQCVFKGTASGQVNVDVIRT